MEKFVLAEKIVFARDMTIAYKLADRHPNLEFWKSIKAKRKINSLVILWSIEARNKLTRQYKEFSERLARHQSLVLDKPSQTFIIGEKTGPDAVIPASKPRSVKDFYKQYG